MRDWGPFEPGERKEWIGEARGEIIVPGGKYLYFSLTPSSANSRDVDDSLATLVEIEGLDLQSLGMYGLNFADTSMELVASLKSLEELSIGGASGFTDSRLQQLRNLDSLRRLSLRNTSVTNDGLKHLLTFPRLEWLDLNGTRIDGGAIKHLRQMNSLRWLDVGETNVTRRHAEKLKLALPYCSIGWSQWRKKATPPPTPTHTTPVS